ncbi:hypothetical protein [Flavobacterium sp.]|uniref:hypothetical protein n=1 Tax=Flavobacterium sp. TaxID=239 RepID=UPI003A8D13F9
MKKAVYFAFMAVMGAVMISCSTEDATENDTGIQQKQAEASVEAYKGMDFSNLFTDVRWNLNIDFSLLYSYANMQELKANSDKNLTEIIDEFRDLIAEKQENGITDIVATIEFKNGEARVKQYLFLDNSLMKEKVEFIDRDGVESITSGEYKAPNSVLTNTIDDDMPTVSDYLVNSLQNSDSVILQFKVNAKAGKGSVYII